MSRSHYILLVLLVVQAIAIVALVCNPILAVALSLVLVLPVVAASVLKWPLAGIILIIFSILLGPVSTFQWGTKIPNLFYADLAIALTLFAMILTRALDSGDNLQFSIGRSGLFLAIFVSFCFATLLAAVDPLRGLGILRNYLMALIMLGLVTACVRTVMHTKYLAYAFVVWGMVLSVVAIGSVLMQHQSSLLGRVTLSWGRANYIATFPVMLIPVILAPVLSGSISKGRFYMMAVGGLLIVTLLFTLSRGGALALLMVLAILTVKYTRLRSLPYLVLFLSMVFLLVYFSPLGRVLLYRFETISASASALVRITRWERTWEVFERNPIAGVGTGNLAYHLPYATQFAKAHNLVLMLLSENGLIGFFIFMVMIIYIIRMQIMNCREIRDTFQNSLSWGILAATVGVLVHAMVEPIFQTYQFSLIFWSFVAVSARQHQWRKEKCMHEKELSLPHSSI